MVGNYHPFTILTLAAEYAFFGLNPFYFHLVNLVLHLLNSTLAGLLTFRLSKDQLTAYTVAVLFAMHPMHVESVAWISQVKDLLYSCFFLLSVLSYVRYNERGVKKYYFLALLMFCLSLLSKAMAVSLPLVLFLVDFLQERKINRRQVLEKVPFLLLATLFGAIAIVAQRSLNAIPVHSIYHFGDRLVFAFSSFFQYLIKLAIPLQLSAFYPYPEQHGHFMPWYIYASMGLTLVLIALAIYSLRHTRKMLFSLGFFAVTIFVVLQLLPVGDAMMADRYSYLSSFGIFYLAGTGLSSFMNQQNRVIAMLACGLYGISLGVLTFLRCGVWEDGVHLWSDVIRQYQHVPIAYTNRGVDHYRLKQYDLALTDFNKAIQLQPDYAWAYLSRGAVHEVQQKKAEALADYNKAITLNPSFQDAYLNRGNLYKSEGKVEEAITDYSKVIAMNPACLEAWVNRGYLYMNHGKLNEAVDDYSRAIELSPDYAIAYFNRGQIFNRQSRFTAAIDDFSTVITLNPNDAEAIYFRGIALYTTGNKSSACSDIQEATRLGYQVPPQAMIEICN